MLWVIFFSGIFGACANFFDVFHLGIHSFFEKKNFLAAPFHFSFLRLVTLKNIGVLFFQHNPLIFFSTLFFLCFGMKIFYQSKNPAQREFIFISVAFGILVAIIANIFFDPRLTELHFLGLRHFQATIIFPAFLCFPIYLSQNEKIIRFINQYYVYCLIAILAYLFLFKHIAVKKAVDQFYPPITQCLDDYASQGELINNNGVANYWDAHANNMLSKRGIKLVATYRNLRPYDWISTRHDYVNSTFHFLLIKKNTLPQTLMITGMRKPDKILSCREDDHYLIYVYRDGFFIFNDH